MTVDHVARPLSDGRYSATCRERTIVAATANGHRDVFPCAEMIVTDGWATFTRDDVEVRSCSARYAASHFDIHSL
ncbi:hypothetical protein DF046_38200 [Burkholderia cepacia]|nr:MULTISPECIES: hypothetical protein [Burkholderia cepacia complex]MDR5647450.1 hypothetical protein [Burkholderia cenocepacia]RQT42446.1 hypothetical protein DF046_38200 [Burkholderia cepacia]